VSVRPVRRAGATLAATAVVLVAIATGASAFWSSHGSGSGSAGVASGPQAVTFTVGTPTTLLYPGHSASVALVAHNPNTYAVHVATLALATDPGAVFTVDAGHSGCDVAALSFVTQDNGGSGWTVPGRVGATDGLLTIDMPSALLMATSAADACQGATFGVRLRTVA
jgi:hypothetical protein